MEQKSPDIIYAQIVAGTLYASREPNEVFGEQFPKYIRMDALLEWIDEYKNYSSGPSWDLLKTHIETL